MKMTGSTKIVADKDTMGIRKIEREDESEIFVEGVERYLKDWLKNVERRLKDRILIIEIHAMATYL